MSTPFLRTKLGWVAILVPVFAAAAVGVWFAFRPPYYHWVEVVPGKVYRSGLLEDDLGSAIDRYGLKTVINLRSVPERSQGSWYEAERRTTAQHGATLVDVPLQEGTPPSPEQVKELLAIFDDPSKFPVLIHCEHGVTRSAGVEGLYRREYLGENGKQALEDVSNLKPELATKYPAIAEFVRNYVPRNERAAGSR